MSTSTKDLDSLFNELVRDPVRGLPTDLGEKVKSLSIQEKWKWLSGYEVLVEQRKKAFDAIVNDPKKKLSDKIKQELHQLPVQHKWGIINHEEKQIKEEQEEEENTISIHCYERDGTLKTVKGDVGKQSLFAALVEGGINIPHWSACFSEVTNSETQLEDYGDGPYCVYCSVHVAEEWLDKLIPQEWKELDVLWYSEDYRRNTRLSCQIPLVKELDGIVVSVAEEHWHIDDGMELNNVSDDGSTNILDQLWESPRQMRELERRKATDAAKAQMGEELRFRRILDSIKKQTTI